MTLTPVEQSFRDEVKDSKISPKSEQDRDLILIVGQNGVGKTTTFKVLAEAVKARQILYEERPVSDLFYLLDEIRKDDALGGLRHYHEWCEEKIRGHQHSNGEPIIPFTVIDNSLIDDMFENFFESLTGLQHTGKFWFVEWTGGVNKNPDNEPASSIDLSFCRINEMLQKGRFSKRWIDRVHTVIHPTADSTVRYKLNMEKQCYYSDDIETGKVSPQKTKTNLDIFKDDDFSSIENFLLSKGIGIHTVVNDGTDIFFRRLHEIADTIFSSAGRTTSSGGSSLSQVQASYPVSDSSPVNMFVPV